MSVLSVVILMFIAYIIVGYLQMEQVVKNIIHIIILIILFACLLQTFGVLGSWEYHR